MAQRTEMVSFNGIFYVMEREQFTLKSWGGGGESFIASRHYVKFDGQVFQRTFLFLWISILKWLRITYKPGVIASQYLYFTTKIPPVSLNIFFCTVMFNDVI